MSLVNFKLFVFITKSMKEITKKYNLSLRSEGLWKKNSTGRRCIKT